MLDRANVCFRVKLKTNNRMEGRQERVMAISRWLQNSANNLGIVYGITRFSADLHKQTITSSHLITFYVLLLNIGTVVSLPFSFYYITAYIISVPTNNLLILTDVSNVAILFIAIAYSILSRHTRETACMGILKEIFAIDRAYFRAQPKCVELQRHSNRLFLLKMYTTLFQAIWPFVGTLQAAKKIDMEAVILACYLSFTIVMPYGVMSLYILQMLEIRCRVCVLNGNLENLQRSLERTHRCAKGRLYGFYVTLERLAVATVRDVNELAKVHERLSKLLVRLNNTFKCQIIAVVLSYILTNVSYCFFVYLAVDGKIETVRSVLLWVASFVSTIFAFMDVNLLYWISQSTTNAFRDNARILQSYRTLPFTNQELDRQCELFALQLLRQEIDVRIGGMFSLNRQTALAIAAFILRHTIILVQFDYETCLSGYNWSITINSFVDMFRFSRV